jgi:DNA-binding transcriptional ArsR family regulator
METDDLLAAFAAAPPMASHWPGEETDDGSARALAGLAALGQPTRLAVFRLLVQQEPDGLAAGAIATIVGAPHNSLSTHLAILVRAGLVSSARSGRSIVYRADLSGMRRLVAFLLADCCGGRPEVCGAVADLLAPSCGCAPGKSEAPATVVGGPADVSPASPLLNAPARTPR